MAQALASVCNRAHTARSRVHAQVNRPYFVPPTNGKRTVSLGGQGGMLVLPVLVLPVHALGARPPPVRPASARVCAQYATRAPTVAAAAKEWVLMESIFAQRVKENDARNCFDTPEVRMHACARAFMHVRRHVWACVPGAAAVVAAAAFWPQNARAHPGTAWLMQTGCCPSTFQQALALWGAVA